MILRQKIVKIKIFFKTGNSVDITHNGDMSINEGEIELYDENRSVCSRFFINNIAGYLCTKT